VDPIILEILSIKNKKIKNLADDGAGGVVQHDCMLDHGTWVRVHTKHLHV
jgi:hypothetical protein